MSVPSRRAVAAATAVIAAATGLAACGSGSTTTNASGPISGQTITLYNAQHEETTDAIVKAFTAKTGVKVVIDSDDEDVLTAKIETEGSKSPADVFFTENSNWLQQLDAKGLLATTTPATLADVPTADSSTDGTWVGVSSRISQLVYNPAKIAASALPTSILDMADPRYKGMFELAPGETDFWPLVSSVSAAKGAAAAATWLNGLKSNAGNGDNVPDNETLTDDVNNGTTDFAVINHYYYYRLAAEKGQSAISSKVASFAPQDPGFVAGISGIGIVRSSKHQAAAQAFLDFVTSSAGQTVLEDGDSFEYPLAAGVAANPVLPPLSSYLTNSFSPAQLGTGLDAKDLLQAASLI